MSNDVVFLDPVSPRGHVSINKFFIETLKVREKRLVVSSELSSLYREICNVDTFQEQWLKKGRFLHSYFTFIICLSAIFGEWKKGNSKIIFLSYDITNFFLLSFIGKILKIKLITFEHNTSPGNSKFKKILQKLCLKNVKRICFSKQIQRQYKALNIDTTIIEHPIINESEKINNPVHLESLSRGFEHIVFCPSASADLSELKLFCQKYPRFLFIVKSKKNFNFTNCYASNFFEEYDWIMSKSSFVYLPINIEGRVSGPLFGGIYHSCKIIVNRNEFGQFCHDQFDNLVQYSDVEWVTNKENFNVIEYNQMVINKFNDFLSI